MWGKHLKAYARKVQEQLPAVSQPADPSLPPSVSLDLPQQQSVCAVVNTCEYCSETTGQLADTVSKQLTPTLTLTLTPTLTLSPHRNPNPNPNPNP